MTLAEEFARAQERVKTLSRPPATDELLELYALYKQGNGGDAEGKRPGLLDVKQRAKFIAWESKKGMTREAAMQAYVALVDTLLAR